MLALASALLPVAAAADGPEPPSPAAPQPPPSPVTGPPASPRRPSALPAAIDRTKSYYVFFEQNIDANSMRALKKQLAALVEAGVTGITLVISSSGGYLFQALNAYSFVRALPATINTHAIGMVASSATVLFLAGESRSSDRNAKFIFHPPQSSVAANVNEQQMHEQLALMEQVEAAVAQIYRERTKLDDAEIQRFFRETVMYTGDQALEHQIVQHVGDLRIPGEQKARIVFVD